MSISVISVFQLPNYKDMIHVSMECYLEGKAPSCHGTELEDFAPIWSKLTSGKFPGCIMKLNNRIRDEEYSMYPIVFINSEYWAAENGAKAHGSTWVHIVSAQRQNLSNCKSYQHRYIDRETGVVILEKTKLHGDCKEPDYKYWFYEKDTRQPLPLDVLKETFTENGPGVCLTVKKFVDLPKTPLGCEPKKIDMDEYEHRYTVFHGYLEGEHIRSLVKQHTFSDSRSIGCLLIEWQDSWNFVIHDEYGQSMFKVSTEDALAFIEQNEDSGRRYV